MDMSGQELSNCGGVADTCDGCPACLNAVSRNECGHAKCFAYTRTDLSVGCWVCRAVRAEAELTILRDKFTAQNLKLGSALALPALGETAERYKTERDQLRRVVMDLLEAMEKAQAGFIELHAQDIGCPDCPPDEDTARYPPLCPAVLAGELALAKARA